MSSNMYIKAAIGSLVFSALPVLALAQGLVGSHMWNNAMDALRGAHIDRLSGLPTQPWLGLLPIFWLTASYVVLSQAALKVVNDVKPNGLFYRRKLIIGLVLMLIASITLNLATFGASLGYLQFGDIKFGAIIPPNSFALIALVSVMAFMLNAYLVVSINRIARH
jgi:hypothetical protein